jgi:hypothetical protein
MSDFVLTYKLSSLKTLITSKLSYLITTTTISGIILKFSGSTHTTYTRVINVVNLRYVMSHKTPPTMRVTPRGKPQRGVGPPPGGTREGPRRVAGQGMPSIYIVPQMTLLR